MAKIVSYDSGSLEEGEVADDYLMKVEEFEDMLLEEGEVADGEDDEDGNYVDVGSENIDDTFGPTRRLFTPANNNSSTSSKDPLSTSMFLTPRSIASSPFSTLPSSGKESHKRVASYSPMYFSDSDRCNSSTPWRPDKMTIL